MPRIITAPDRPKPERIYPDPLPIRVIRSLGLAGIVTILALGVFAVGWMTLHAGDYSQVYDVSVSIAQQVERYYEEHRRYPSDERTLEMRQGFRVLKYEVDGESAILIVERRGGMGFVIVFKQGHARIREVIGRD